MAYVKRHRQESVEIVKKKLRIGPEQERNLDRSIELLITKYYEQIPSTSQR